MLTVLGVLPAGSDRVSCGGSAARHRWTDVSFNIIKFHRDEFKLSLLDYPEFMSDPHPSLSLSTVIDLEKMGLSIRSYAEAKPTNPPSQGNFLPPEHEMFDGFRNLTAKEERLGLYQNRTKIGFEKQWQALHNGTWHYL